MSSSIDYKGQYLWMSNVRFSGLIEFALDVGARTQRSASEAAFVERLRREAELMWAGIGMDLEQQFPELEAKKFWCRVFYDLAREIFLRRIGKQDTDCWQAGAIFEAQFVARLLKHAVREKDVDFLPATEDARAWEAWEAHERGGMNARL